MRKILGRYCVGLTLISMSLGAYAADPEKVSFPSLDHWTGDSPLMIDGYLYKPQDKARYTTVVMFHGCAGALNKQGVITKRFRDMAGLLNQMGHGVLLVDSFNPRGSREICTTRPRDRTILSQHRWLDAYGAIDYLGTRDDVVPDKIGAIGFSHGGTNALEIMDANLPAYIEKGRGFAASVSMYPGCGQLSRKKPEFKAYGPLLIQVGELDDWTPAAPCEQLAERSQQRGEPVEFVSYPDAYHGFDQTSKVRLRKDVTHGVYGKAGVHVGGNPVARELAYQRIREFFSRHLGK